MGEDGELLDRDGFVAILSFTNHFKTQAEDVRDGAVGVGAGGEGRDPDGSEMKMLTLPFSFKS